jgi:hypothetical protein
MGAEAVTQHYSLVIHCIHFFGGNPKSTGQKSFQRVPRGALNRVGIDGV